MSPRQPVVLASRLGPGLQAKGETLPQRYGYSYQLYQEDDNRMRIESHCVRLRYQFNKMFSATAAYERGNLAKPVMAETSIRSKKR